MPVPSDSSPSHHLAYVFERFPSFTQTFCVRELLELERLGLRPLIFSIHDTRDENIRHFPDSLFDRVHILPPPDELIEVVKSRKDANEFPQGVVLTLRHWGNRQDKLRIYEAAYIGSEMQRAGVRHAHSHFAGIGARTCFWLKPFYGHTYSFTGHANDIFCDRPTATDKSTVTLEHLIREARFVTTVSDFSARKLKQQFPFAKRSVHRVYNGLDLEPFARAIDGSKDHPPVILSVGRLIEKKGFDDLIRAMGIMRNKSGTPVAACKIVGDGPLHDELSELISSTGTDDCVTLLGPKSQSKIIDLLASASIFALPCVTEQDGGMDNLPTVIMEAMAAGLPCVSTRLAGVPEMVIDGKTGKLVAERDPEAFADALNELLAASSQQRSALGLAGLQTAREKFAKEVTAQQLAGIFADEGCLNASLPLDKSRSGFSSALRRIRNALTPKPKPIKRPLEHYQL